MAQEERPEKIESLRVLQRALEDDYRNFKARFETHFSLASKWTHYLNNYPDQADFCIGILLAQEHETNKASFLTTFKNNLAAKIIIEQLKKINDDEYLEALNNHIAQIIDKASELGIADAETFLTERPLLQWLAYLEARGKFIDKIIGEAAEIKFLSDQYSQPSPHISSFLLGNMQQERRNAREALIQQAEKFKIQDVEKLFKDQAAAEKLKELNTADLEKAKQLKTFLDAFPFPLLESKRLPVLLHWLSTIPDFSEIDLSVHIATLIALSTHVDFPRLKIQQNLPVMNVLAFILNGAPPEKKVNFLLWHFKKMGLPFVEAFKILSAFVKKPHEEFTKKLYKKINPAITVETKEDVGATITSTQGTPYSPRVRLGKKNQDTTDAGLFSPANNGFETFSTTQKEFCVKEVFNQFQKQCGNEESKGSTAMTCVLSGNNYTVGHVGDSYAFLVVRNINDGSILRCEQINSLHNGLNDEEKERLKDHEKGEFSPTGRLREKEFVNDIGLAMSRAIGDTSCEKLGLLHEPDIIHGTVNLADDEEAFFVLASDGFGERKNNPADYLQQKLSSEHSPREMQALSSYLVTQAVEDKTTDNTTVLVISVTPNVPTPKYAAVFDGHGGSIVSESLKEKSSAIFRQAVVTEKARQAKLKEELKQLQERTEKYLTNLQTEIANDKQDFFDTYNLFNPVISLEATPPICQLGVLANEEEKNAIDESFSKIVEKRQLQAEAEKLLVTLNLPTDADKNTDENKLKHFEQTLFDKPQQNNPPTAQAVAEPKKSLAMRLEEKTRRGTEFIKDVLKTLALFSGVGTLPMLAYCLHNHKWPWQTEGKGLIEHTKAIHTKLVPTIKVAPGA